MREKYISGTGLGHPGLPTMSPSATKHPCRGPRGTIHVIYKVSTPTTPHESQPAPTSMDYGQLTVQMLQSPYNLVTNRAGENC